MSEGGGMSVNCLSAGGQTVATDVKGNITTLPANLHPAGATTAMNLTWDSDNKLRSADIHANGTADVNFQNDAIGRRVARTGTGGSVVYVQMDQQTIADYTVGGAATTPTFRYVYASYIDEPVVRKGPTSTVHFYHREQQYSITAIASNGREIRAAMIEGGCSNCTLIWILLFSIVAMGCRNPSTDLEDYVHRSISVEEFQFDKSIKISMGRRLAIHPGLRDVLFKFSGDESIYDLAAKPEISVRQSFAEGSRGNSEKFACIVTKAEVGGETIVTISSSVLIDSSLQEKNAFIEIYSGAGTLIARKTMFVTLEEKKKDMRSN